MSATVAVLLRVSEAVPVTGVATVLLQRAWAGQVASPPPLTVAVLLTVVPAIVACGVTGITKLALPPAASPAATVQVTVWPEAVQPAGNVPMTRPAGMASVITEAAVVAAVPVLRSVRV